MASSNPTSLYLKDVQTYLPPAILALFGPRPAPMFKTPLPRKSMQKIEGIAKYVSEFNSNNEWPSTLPIETKEMRKEKSKTEKMEKHKKILEQRALVWHPHDNPKATKDPLKTLFVARLSYELNEDDLRREFSKYGSMKDVKLIRDLNGKSRGYAFIEFKESRDLKEAFQRADGKRLKGRRILVDVERGRTVPSWKPRKLGGGLGQTRQSTTESKLKEDRRSSRERKEHHGKSRSRTRSRDKHRKKEKHHSDRNDRYDDRRHHRKNSRSRERRHRR